MSTPYEREEAIITDQYNRGEISAAEYRDALRELQREVEAEAQEAAERAYNDTLNNF